MKLVTLLLLVMLCIAPIVGIAVADDDDGDDVDDEIEEAEERELHIEISDDQVEVESEIETEEMENEFEIHFSTDEGIALDLEYSSEVNATEYELELEVKFLRLVEFIDENEDGVLSEGEAVQTIDLTDLQYSSPTVTQITSDDDEAGYRLESHSVDQTFVFQIIAYTFPKHAMIDDTTVNPTEMKITIVITNFPYQEDDGALALLIKATSEMEMETDTTNEEEDIEIELETATGYFSWSNEASVDGAQRPVNSTVTKTEEGSLIALTYPQGTEIGHDPKLGVSILPTIAAFPWLYFVAGAAIIALVIAVAIRISRPRIQNSIPTVLCFAGVESRFIRLFLDRNKLQKT